jgi:hypothetical protein
MHSNLVSVGVCLCAYRIRLFNHHHAFYYTMEWSAKGGETDELPDARFSLPPVSNRSKIGVLLLFDAALLKSQSSIPLCFLFCILLPKGDVGGIQ